jgi:hypothetical protein
VVLRRFVPNLRAEGKHDEAERLIGASFPQKGISPLPRLFLV